MATRPAVLLFGILSSSVLAEARPPAFRVKDIGSLAGDSTFATALNDRGQVVGSSVMGSAGPHSAAPSNAFLYSDDVLTDLFGGETNAYGEATAVNEAGLVVGYRRWGPIGPAQPFRYSPRSGMVEYLDPFGVGNPLAATGMARGVNESGQIAGTVCSLLGAFVNEVEAHSGKKISEEDAARLVEAAAFIRGLLGCG